ncbi:ArsR/SmtB family transcription factor [Kitasatospora sp. NPDC057198]|uniref:ArsR/SmtB family transcription factor n=1 Tax=Kitasatospora sp. NPDC057198 TaxID=3346046 RepID=UPI00363A58ED
MTDDSPATRRVTDARALSALAHPLRQRLLDLLKVHGPATVGLLAERSGEAVGSVSHHLRVLAGAGLVTGAPELARDRRESWWRLVAPEVRWARGDFTGDPASAAAHEAAGSLLLERQFALLRSWAGRSAGYPEPWREGCAMSAETWLRLTPEEAREFNAQLLALLDSWAARTMPDDGAAREPVLVVGHTVPAAP